MPIIQDHPLRLARIRAGVSQRELAERARVNRNTITAIEEGRTASPSQATVFALAPILGLRGPDLMRLLYEWTERRRQQRPALSTKALAALQVPAELVPERFPSFIAWRLCIAPSPTAFASLLGVNRAVVARYEAGERVYGMSDTLMRAIATTLRVDDEYLLAVASLPVREE